MPATILRKAIVYGEDTAVFGLPGQPLPLKGFPEGRIRLRIYPDDFTVAIVKTPDRTRAFYVKEEGGHWVPYAECNPPPFGKAAGQQIRELRMTLNRYRVLLFGTEYRQENIETIRTLAAENDPGLHEHPFQSDQTP